MKKVFYLFLFCSSISNVTLSQGGVSINATGNAPDPSAMLDISGVGTGVLINRMTTAERDAIVAPTNGLLIYNTDCNNFNYWTTDGWRPLNNNGGNVDDAEGIDGQQIVCTSQTGLTYTVNPIANASAYVWSYTGSGLSVSSGANTNSINVDFSPAATSGKLRVYGLNECGTGTPAVFQIIVQSVPSVPEAYAAYGITISSFYVNWSTPENAVEYFLDVSTDPQFSSLDPNYNNLYVGNTSSYNVTGLNSSTQYYYRVRAGNSCGVSDNSNSIGAATTASCSGTITDSRDGKVYTIVQIGTQCWMKKNLNYDQNTFGNDYCYNNDVNNCTTYGRLYDWAAMMQGSSSSNNNPSGVQGVCPSGWHVPADAEWCQLENYVEPGVNSGCGATGWLGSSLGLNLQPGGSSGFDALLGGYLYNGVNWTYLGYDGAFWTSREAGGANAWSRVVEQNSPNVLRSNYEKTRAYSVRCVRD